MSISTLAIEWNYVGYGIVMVVVLFSILLLPYLIREIRVGKGELGPLRRLGPHGTVTYGPPVPPGAGDNNPGRPGDPAPGMPDGQADPWSRRAQREGPPIRS